MIVGESGSGKTTLCRTLAGLLKPSCGQIYLKGKLLHPGGWHERQDISFIFQGQSALDPQLTLFEVIAEPLRAQRLSSNEIQERVSVVCALACLDEWRLNEVAGELSGGQLQRVALARALIIQPYLLIADEFTSALDVLLQAQLINTLLEQKELGLTLLLVSHDLQLAHCIADRKAVMYAGRIVEIASADELLTRPLHTYTQQLCAVQLPLEPLAARRVVEQYTPSQVILPANGALQEIDSGHWVFC